jgi:hypothetical protein
VRALLASAPADPERRDNFARSLLQGIEGVREGDYTSPFALAKVLLEVGVLHRWPAVCAGTAESVSQQHKAA